MPPASRTVLAVILGIALGTAVGIGGFTFSYAKGAAYLKDDPAACANCHVMNEQYDAWLKSSHRSVAECNDCHTPHEFVPKYAVKAINGFNHSFAFTTGLFHEPIQIKGFNRVVTENACRKCHASIVEAIETPPAGHEQVAQSEQLQCLTCHNSVGHPEGSGNPELIRMEDAR